MAIRESTEKYKIPIKKNYKSNKKVVTRTDKDGEEIVKIIPYILQFTDSARFMASSLSKIVNNPYVCFKMYKLDRAGFFSVTGLVRQAVFKKTEVKLDLLTDINTLLMLKKVIRG